MTTMLVWLLISTGGYGGQSLVNLGMFKSVTQCEHVIANLPNAKYQRAKCIQAEILVPK